MFLFRLVGVFSLMIRALCKVGELQYYLLCCLVLSLVVCLYLVCFFESDLPHYT
jgi:hypothetical protein